MSDLEPDYLDRFSDWLQALGQDAERIGQIAARGELPEPARQALVAGVNYVFKSLDLVPDGIDDIGYLDDAFVLRIAATQAQRDDLSTLAPDSAAVIDRLAQDAQVVEQFLGQEYTRLAGYVTGLQRTAARGRSVPDVLHDHEIQTAFLSDLRAFAQSYEAPGFAREEKNLVKLRAFFDAKLPKA